MNDVFISNNGQLRVKSNLLCRRRPLIPRMLRAAVRKIQAARPGQARLHERGVPLIPTRDECDVIVQKKSRSRHLFRGCYVQQCVRYRRLSLDGLHERGGPGDPGAGKSGEGLRRNT